MHFCTSLQKLLRQKLHLFTGTFATILLGAMLVVLSACGSTAPAPGGISPSTPSTSSTPSTVLTQGATGIAQSSSQEKLKYIQMIDRTNGWAITDQDIILHTTTGGIRWQEVFPPNMNGAKSVDFFSADRAWAARLDNSSSVRVARTVDGGSSWQETTFSLQQPFQAQGIITLTFPNEQDGWILLDLGSGAGTGYVALYRTTDGGTSWHLASGNISSGHKTGVSFLNGSNGWLTGYNGAITNYIFLFVTKDGGSTWKLQQLQPPSSDSYYTTYPTAFFNAQDGVLPVTWIENNTNNLNVYVTHDGGSTWTKTTTLHVSPTSNTVVSHILTSFADANHWWVSDTSNKSLYRTTDGGQSWSSLSSDFNVKSLDFISSDLGWAVPDDKYLLATIDSGNHWLRVPYIIS